MGTAEDSPEQAKDRSLPVQKGTEEGMALFTSLDGRNLKIGVLARELWER